MIFPYRRLWRKHVQVVSVGRYVNTTICQHRLVVDHPARERDVLKYRRLRDELETRSDADAVWNVWITTTESGGRDKAWVCDYNQMAHVRSHVDYAVRDCRMSQRVSCARRIGNVD